MDTKIAKTFLQQWLRRDWPTHGGRGEEHSGVAVVFVNYNTLDLAAYLLFSIFRVLGREQVGRIVVIDNNSTDGSRQLLERFADAGQLDLIANRKQRYHGPAINQAISFLAAEQGRGGADRRVRYVWILDSDVIILRNDTVRDAVFFLKRQQAAAVGQFQYDALPEGYAHISSLLIDPAKCWRRQIAPFDNTGAPAANFQRSLRTHGLKVGNFPFRADHYLLHLARGTLKSIYDQDDRGNLYYQWASAHAVHHYHGDPGGRLIHDRFLEVFRREVPEPTPEGLLAACLKPDLVEIPLPPKSELSRSPVS